MKRSLTPLAVAALGLAAACSDAGTPTAAPVAAPLLSSAEAIPGQYIVVLNQGANPRSVAAVAGISPRYVYTAAVNGFAAALNQGQLTALRHNPNVAYIEADQPVTALRHADGRHLGHRPHRPAEPAPQHQLYLPEHRRGRPRLHRRHGDPAHALRFRGARQHRL